MSSDQEFMQRALSLAAATTALASPNPQVGCVLVQDGTVIGEGAHIYDKRDHAEIAALKQAAGRGLSPRGATAYVTLEPCSHHGRTPPCADALIAAEIARAVVATSDPNHLVGGQGLAKLREAGIEVTLGVGEREAREINDAFAQFIRNRRPLVTLKAALSSDGKLAPSPIDRVPKQPHWLTGPAARSEVQRLRHASDAILTGIGTVLADDPALTDRSGISGPGDLPRRRPLLRVVLDSHLRLPLDSQLVRSAKRDLLVLCGPEASRQSVSTLEAAGVEVQSLPLHNGRLSLGGVLDLLAMRQCISLLLETGSHLNGAFLTQQLVDRVFLFFADQKLGEAAIPFADGVASPDLVVQRLTRFRRSLLGPDTLISGYLRDPWQDLPIL